MKKLKKCINATMIFAILLYIKITPILADVKFNQSKAKADSNALLDPVSNFLIGIGFGATLVSIGGSYLSYMGKSDDEKEQLPFHKTIKKHVLAFVGLGAIGMILKWFTIS